MNSSRHYYQRAILEHNKSPRGYGVLQEHTSKCEGRNPLCGDAYTVYICLDGERLTSVSFEGAGCAISKASASVMTTLVEGRTLSEIAAIHDRFKNLLSGSEVDLNESELSKAERNETESQQGERESNVPVADSKLQDLNLFEGLRETKSRVKCALLCWSALYGAIAQESSSTTESS